MPRAFAFTDVIGSTELLDRLGDRRFAALMTAHDAVVRDALPAGDADAAFLGDGFMVAFGDPSAALPWAAAVQRGMARLGLPVRMGAHAGTAVRHGATWLGRDVVVARRLCEQAGAGEILISETLAAWAPGGAARTREIALKGLSHPQRVRPLCI
jgi:class 3 adenylate cyclase